MPPCPAATVPADAVGRFRRLCSAHAQHVRRRPPVGVRDAKKVDSPRSTLMQLQAEIRRNARKRRNGISSHSPQGHLAAGLGGWTHVSGKVALTCKCTAEMAAAGELVGQGGCLVGQGPQGQQRRPQPWCMGAGATAGQRSALHASLRGCRKPAATTNLLVGTHVVDAGAGGGSQALGHARHGCSPADGVGPARGHVGACCSSLPAQAPAVAQAAMAAAAAAPAPQLATSCCGAPGTDRPHLP